MTARLIHCGRSINVNILYSRPTCSSSTTYAIILDKLLLGSFLIYLRVIINGQTTSPTVFGVNGKSKLVKKDKHMKQIIIIIRYGILVIVLVVSLFIENAPQFHTVEEVHSPTPIPQPMMALGVSGSNAMTW